jgi:hypothetical protein
MIDLKQAVQATYDYLQSLQGMMGHPLNNLRLEEVELSEDRNFWLITLGFDSIIKKNRLAIELDISTREYKIFKVNSQSGEVEAMKIRSL